MRPGPCHAATCGHSAACLEASREQRLQSVKEAEGQPEDRAGGRRGYDVAGAEERQGRDAHAVGGPLGRKPQREAAEGQAAQSEGAERPR